MEHYTLLLGRIQDYKKGKTPGVLISLNLDYSKRLGKNPYGKIQGLMMQGFNEIQKQKKQYEIQN